MTAQPGGEVFLVTGALGCIGSWVVRLLVEEGTPVIAADLGSDRSRFELVLDGVDAADVPVVPVDVTDYEQVSAVLDAHGVTSIVHLAALQVPFCRADPVAGAKVNVLGTVHVFEAAAARRDLVRSVVYAGSVGMFDTADADPETARVAADAAAHPRSHYGVYKLANEGSARVYWEERGVPSVGLRPFVVYGPGRDQGVTSSPTMAMLAAATGRPYTVGYGGRVQLQYAADAARAFLAASRRVTDGARTLNLGGPVADVDEIVQAIESAAPESKGMLDISDQRLPFPESVDTTETRAFLGDLPATSLEDGVAATVDHFRRLHEAGRLPASLVAKLD